jgi:lysophospholipase L1-like esterase
MTTALSQSTIRYLALGDSYTIGEQVPQNQSWPFQLTDYLQTNGFKVTSPEVIAVTGWRTDELQDSVATKQYKANSFDLVSLLIGVNNQYQNKPLKQFKTEFEDLLKTAINLSKHNEQGVFVVGIPDYSLSGFAQKKKLKKVSGQLKRYNKAIKRITKKYQVDFYPLQELSKPLHKEKAMLAGDMLHPSGEQYKRWVDSFKAQVLSKLNSF